MFAVASVAAAIDVAIDVDKSFDLASAKTSAWSPDEVLVTYYLLSIDRTDEEPSFRAEIGSRVNVAELN
jgi:hypothetical protein